MPNGTPPFTPVETTCKECACFQRIQDHPVDPQLAFCVRRPRQFVRGLPELCEHSEEDPPPAIRVNGFICAYPVQHEDDVCYDGVAKE